MKAQKTLAELHETNLKLAESDRHLAYTTYPDLFFPYLPRPCVVRILMVTDNGGDFSTTADFGLGELLEVLSVAPGPYVSFAVTKANRRSDPTADLQNFVFGSTVTTENFDQIWLFGLERSGNFISDQELRVLSQFMNEGGGVFATGDHEDLGIDLCGKVPRVRNMRKWYFDHSPDRPTPYPIPAGEPLAPPVDGPDRHDTLRVGSDPNYQFDDQSDAVPQTITPRYYHHRSSRYTRIRYPHPVLCGPEGPIKVLPDHPHEGECYVPDDLTLELTFDGYHFAEYPLDSSGNRRSPEVIAWATILGGRQAPLDVKGPVNPKSFGVIGAYDGHKANVGRVVVDSTWHHFFNINLKGTPGGTTPEKRGGFKASTDPTAQAAYRDIKAYFRNIAVWLAPPARRTCMRNKLLWAARWDSQVVIEFPPGVSPKELSYAKLRSLGEAARDVLGRIATRCQGIEFVIDILPELPEQVSPWPPPFHVDDFNLLDPDEVINVVLGSVLVGIGNRFPMQVTEDKKAVDEVLPQILADSTRVALTRVKAELASLLDRGRAKVQVLSQMLGE